MKKAISLNGLWNLYYSDKYDTSVKNPHEIEEIEKTKIKATVPCNVETALADAGIIDKDLYKAMATQENMKFEDYHWWFERDFEVDKIKEGEKICMNFGMVDLFCQFDRLFDQFFIERIMIRLFTGEIHRHQRLASFRPRLVFHHPHRAWAFA